MLPHPYIGDTALDRQVCTYLEQPTALVPVRLNYLQRYREELGNTGYQMLPYPKQGTLIFTDQSSKGSS